MGHDEVWHPGAEPGAGRPGSSVMDNRSHLRQQPVMRRAFRQKNVIRQGTIISQSTPTGSQNRTLSRFCQRIED